MTDRLDHAAPSAKALFLAAAKRGHHLGVLARGLTELLDAHGSVARERAIADAVHLAGVRHLIQTTCIARTAPMNRHTPPLIAVPNDLSDEAAAKLSRPSTNSSTSSRVTTPTSSTATTIVPDARQTDLWSETDPPL